MVGGCARGLRRGMLGVHVLDDALITSHSCLSFTWWHGWLFGGFRGAVSLEHTRTLPVHLTANSSTSVPVLCTAQVIKREREQMPLLRVGWVETSACLWFMGGAGVDILPRAPAWRRVMDSVLTGRGFTGEEEACRGAEAQRGHRRAAQEYFRANDGRTRAQALNPQPFVP